MELANLDFSYSDKSDLLFKNFNLKIEPEKITVFLGPSGCGKSTLLRLFAGLLKGSSVSPVRDEIMSFIFQDSTLLTWRTCEKNIMLPFVFSEQKLDANHFQQLVEILKIKDVLQRYPAEISGGQKMRVSIARALVTKPKVLFMDEPFSALDEPTRMNLQDELLNLQTHFQMTILFVTHSFYEAAYLADRILVLNQTRPIQIVLDEMYVKKNNDRFDDEYQRKVSRLSEIFKSLKSQRSHGTT